MKISENFNTYRSQSTRDSFNHINENKQKCCYCEIKLTVSSVTREHVIPKSKKGKGRNFNHKNIRPCCEICNQEKRNMTLIEYRSFLYQQAGIQNPDILHKKITNIERLIRNKEK